MGTRFSFLGLVGVGIGLVLSGRWLPLPFVLGMGSFLAGIAFFLSWARVPIVTALRFPLRSDLAALTLRRPLRCQIMTIIRSELSLETSEIRLEPTDPPGTAFRLRVAGGAAYSIFQTHTPNKSSIALDFFSHVLANPEALADALLDRGGVS